VDLSPGYRELGAPEANGVSSRVDDGCMRIGIGLPAAVPETDMTLIARRASEAERAGFESVGVIDRLIYDNLDPLIPWRRRARGGSSAQGVRRHDHQPLRST
jgi:hypothetical protein